MSGTFFSIEKDGTGPSLTAKNTILMACDNGPANSIVKIFRQNLSQWVVFDLLMILYWVSWLALSYYSRTIRGVTSSFSTQQNNTTANKKQELRASKAEEEEELYLIILSTDRPVSTLTVTLRKSTFLKEEKQNYKNLVPKLCFVYFISSHFDGPFFEKKNRKIKKQQQQFLTHTQITLTPLAGWTNKKGFFILFYLSAWNDGHPTLRLDRFFFFLDKK